MLRSSLRVLDRHDIHEAIAVCTRDIVANLFVAARLVSTGIQPRSGAGDLWGYYGNACGDADGNGINETVSALTLNLDWRLFLTAQASAFGANLSIVQNRQDFTKNMISTLQTGADNLVLADSNEEAANLLALQTRQQLSTTALSLASQADQAVLRLF